MRTGTMRRAKEVSMLLFDDAKKLEKTLGVEAAAVIAQVFEKADENWRRDLATKSDLEIGLAKTKHEILRWMVGGFIAQSALLMAVLAFLR
jgi:uncharacterized membrane protein YukC